MTLFILYILSLIAQITASSNETVTLEDVSTGTSGKFRCEVMADKPFFETDTKEKEMIIIGKNNM